MCTADGRVAELVGMQLQARIRLRLLAPNLTALVDSLAADVRTNRRLLGEFGVDPFGAAVEAITDGIRVRVRVAPCGALSSWPELLFVYRVEIDGMPDAPTVGARLATRHWRIVNKHGIEQRVDGPG